jgi:hypothetical protein
MAELALLGSLLTLILSACFGAACVRRCSTLALRATRREKAPEKWQSRLAELESEVLSLSSSFEKVARQTTRLNSRAGMRELRAETPEEEPRNKNEAPPPGAPKSELREWARRNGLKITV